MIEVFGVDYCDIPMKGNIKITMMVGEVGEEVFPKAVHRDREGPTHTMLDVLPQALEHQHPTVLLNTQSIYSVIAYSIMQPMCLSIYFARNWWLSVPISCHFCLLSVLNWLVGFNSKKDDPKSDIAYNRFYRGYFCY